MKAKEEKGQKGPRIRQVRQALRECNDGLTTHEMERMLDIDRAHLSRILTKMPDAYIDRWVSVMNNGYMRAVWCVAIPPDNCPRPRPQPKEKAK